MGQVLLQKNRHNSIYFHSNLTYFANTDIDIELFKLLYY